MEVINDFTDEEYIEVIVYFNQQLDFEQEIGKSKYEVVEDLKEISENYQQRVIDYIEEEENKGNVLEYNSYYIINALHLKARENVIRNISNMDEVKTIYPNTKIEIEEPEISKMGLFKSDEGSVPWNIKRIGADKVWEEFGIDGNGVVIGIIDSGVFWEHEALKEKWRGYNPNDPENPISDENWFDATSNKNMPYDISISPHGTHVAGTILGQDNAGENKIGVAPGSKWIAAKAFTSSGGYSSWLLSAGQWMLAPNGDPDLAPDIINNSWGSSDKDEFHKDEWFRGMVQAWRAAGILPVFASGNTSSEEDEAKPGSISNPGNYPESFSVGAVDIENKLAAFSKRGPSPYGQTIKPEITAPGVNIKSSVKDGRYESGWNGTSMAAPHISGVAALILSANKHIGLDDLEEIIKTSATPLTDEKYLDSPNQGYGYGLVNAYEAVKTAMENRFVAKVQGTVMAYNEDINIEEARPIDAKISIVDIEKKYDKTNIIYSTMSNLLDGNYLLAPSISNEGENLIIRVESNGYESQEIELEINSSSLITRNFILQKLFAGSIKGQIKDQDKFLSGVEIKIKGDKRIEPVFSNEDGEFQLNNIQDGKKTLLISKKNYETKEIEVEINSKQLDLEAIQMTKSKYGSIEIGYDDGTSEAGVVEKTDEEGVSGTAMRITPSRLGNLLGANIYFTDDGYTLPNKDRIGIAIDGIDLELDESLMYPIFFEIERGKWNFLDLSRLNYSTDGDFHIVTVQEGAWGEMPLVGLDKDTEDNKRSYFYNSEGPCGLSEDIDGENNGTLMIRAIIEYEIGIGKLTNIPKFSYTNKKSISIEGSIDKDNDILVYNNGHLVKEIVTKDNKFDMELQISEGENKIVIESVIGENAIETDWATIIKDSINPVLKLTSPKNNEVFTQSSIKIIGNVEEEHLDKLLINDKVVDVDSKGKFNLDIELQKGENNITIDAFDKAGNSIKDTIKVTYKENNTKSQPKFDGGGGGGGGGGGPSGPPSPPSLPVVAVPKIPPLEPVKNKKTVEEDSKKDDNNTNKIKKFSDLENFKWAEESIEYLSDRGIIQGKTESNFEPGSNITRAEFATLIVRILELDGDLDISTPFNDVNPSDWYYKSILLAYKNGLINGKSQMEFDPYANITREEIIKILGNLLIKKEYKLEKLDVLDNFSDKATIANWAKEEAALVVQNGIILGDDGQFMPKKDTTRAEAAMVAYRLYKLLNE